MKTLVIHPKDNSTDFLSVIYANKDWTVITENPSNSKLRQQIKEHDRIIMLGHGTAYGLIGHKRLIIHSNHVHLLRQKEVIAIWCHADQFVKKYGLKGFYTGMFISEFDEAYNESVYNVSVSEIDLSNSIFAKAVGEYADSSNMLEEVKKAYMNNNCPVVVYNYDRLNYNNPN